MSKAIWLVGNGYAEVTGDRSIRLFPKKIAISHETATSYQGDAYFAAAIDKNAQFVQGGLTRHEHQPAMVSRYQGAKVGHQ